MKRILLLLAIIPTILFAQKPQDLTHNTTTFVDDYANIYTPEEKAQLGSIIHNFFDTVQIALVTVKSLEGNDVQELATTLFNKWGVGSKSNNGLLILIAPTEHKAFAATGRAIQGELTDLQCAKLQREVMVPEFKKGNYFLGTKNLLNAYIAKLSPSANQYAKEQEAIRKKCVGAVNESAAEILIIILMCVPVVVFIGFVVKRQQKKAKEKSIEEKRISSNYFDLRNQLVAINLSLDMTFEECKSLSPKIESLLSLPSETIKEKQIFIVYYQEFQVDNRINLKNFRINKAIKNEATTVLQTYNPSAYDKEVGQIIGELSDKLIALIFDKTDYGDKISALTDSWHRIKIIRDKLAASVAAMKWDDVAKLITALDLEKKAFNDNQYALQTVITNDKEKQRQANNGKNDLLTRVLSLQGYTKKKGISQHAITKTNEGIAYIKGKLTGWDNLQLAEKYLLYTTLLLSIPACEFAKNESDEIDRCEREEKDRIAKVAAAARRKKEEEEAEESRRRRNSSSSYVGYSFSNNSYDSPSSSSFSSSDSGSSDFGGGSSDGGGGGSSW